MANYYIYLISSLPSLSFTTQPLISFEKFLMVSREFIPAEDAAVMKLCSIVGNYDCNVRQQTLKKWFEYDTALRNELVKVRSARKHLEPEKYLRKDGYEDSFVYHIAHTALRNPSILEAERSLDEARWRFLDGLSFGHYFDLDTLIIYGLRLLILERWERVNNADKPKLLEGVLSEIKVPEKA